MTLIDDLGNIDEQIKENHSSERLFNALDWTLYQGVQLVLQHTTLVEDIISIYINTETRKKISNVTPVELRELAYHFFNGSPDTRLDTLQKMTLNRELLMLPVQMAADYCDEYCRSVSRGSMDTWRIRQELMVREPDRDVTLFLIHTKIWFTRYLQLREAIMEKFYRLMVKDIGKYKHVIADKVDKNDMASEYLLNEIKSISKFDSSSGAFTSYLQRWLKNARGDSLTTDEIGIAYTLPHPVRVKIGQGKGYSEINNFSAQLPDDAADDTRPQLEHKSEQEVISMLASVADPKGLYRLTTEMNMDLHEFLDSTRRKAGSRRKS